MSYSVNKSNGFSSVPMSDPGHQHRHALGYAPPHSSQFAHGIQMPPGVVYDGQQGAARYSTVESNSPAGYKLGHPAQVSANLPPLHHRDPHPLHLQHHFQPRHPNDHFDHQRHDRRISPQIYIPTHHGQGVMSAAPASPSSASTASSPVPTGGAGESSGGPDRSTNKRTLQNREAQRNYRKRRDAYIKGLEGKSFDLERLSRQYESLSHKNLKYKTQIGKLRDLIRKLHTKSIERRVAQKFSTGTAADIDVELENGTDWRAMESGSDDDDGDDNDNGIAGVGVGVDEGEAHPSLRAAGRSPNTGGSRNSRPTTSVDPDSAGDDDDEFSVSA